jgi:hypothetical protein
MTVYECELAVLHQHRQAIVNEADRARLRGPGLSLRSRVALILRNTADRVEPIPAAPAPADYQRGVLA